MKINFELNGKPVLVDAPANLTLVTLLRDHLGLTGTKIGCEVGECGACSIIFDGKVVNSCMMLAPQANGHSIITIEGIHSADDGPNDLQQSLIEHGAVQCGYCTPGMVMAGEALLARTLTPTIEDIQMAIAGNLCRCTGYQQIEEAIMATARSRQKHARRQSSSKEAV
jgi:aerobic-type carbon monoxide dehydrogenase small subunit (CoxS/CutS family)